MKGYQRLVKTISDKFSLKKSKGKTKTPKKIYKKAKPKKVQKKGKNRLHALHFFDVIIILLLINICAAATVVFYLNRIKSYELPKAYGSFINITSVPLYPELNQINASAAAYVVYDASDRTVIAGKNNNLRFSPASTAKVMTAILALEHFKLNDILTVPANVYEIDGSKMNLVPGEKISVESLLYGLMLPSGNDSAYTLAYNYPGGIDNFVRSMNKKAEILKLLNTHFEDPSGFSDRNFTTAEELVRLGAYAMEKREFAKIVRTKFIKVFNSTYTHEFLLYNLNELLQYPDIVGIKTGFTEEAGGVLLTAVLKDNKLLIISVLKSEDRFLDTKDIVNFIREKIKYSFPD